MKTKMFTVYDSKAQLYLPPFYMQSTGQAMRAFEETANDSNHAFGKHPEDYTIYEIGTFDDNDCKIDLYKHQITLGKAIEMLVKPEQPQHLDPEIGDIHAIK